MKSIPIHLLKDRTNLGLHLKRFEKADLPDDDSYTLDAHRDDHYIFFMLEKGSGHLIVDFNDIQLSGGILYYILPSQVHHHIRTKEVDGWFMAVDTTLITTECRNVFESKLLLQKPFSLNERQLRQLHNLMLLLHEKYEEANADLFHATALHALLQSFLAITAGCYNGYGGINLKVSRLTQLTSQFKNLLVTDLRLTKAPAAYAAKLNVSEAYLSEAIKKTTGFPVSYWIHQEVVMEAKRLLYYSPATVKEIAHSLGYTDHSYFSRLFKKITHTSANSFREQYRK